MEKIEESAIMMNFFNPPSFIKEKLGLSSTKNHWTNLYAWLFNFIFQILFVLTFWNHFCNSFDKIYKSLKSAIIHINSPEIYFLAAVQINKKLKLFA